MSGGAGFAGAGGDNERRNDDGRDGTGRDSGRGEEAAGGAQATVEAAPVEIEAPAKKWQGQNVPRKEDKRLTQGEGVFVDDIKRHGMGFIHFVRSPYAHAHITSIDVSAAEQVKGVYGTLTGEEVASLT